MSFYNVEREVRTTGTAEPRTLVSGQRPKLNVKSGTTRGSGGSLKPLALGEGLGVGLVRKQPNNFLLRPLKLKWILQPLIKKSSRGSEEASSWSFVLFRGSPVRT